MRIFEALKGISGQFEVQRVLGAVGTLTYTFTVPIFVWQNIIHDVGITEFCIAYPGGLAACIGATAGAIALKDRQVAKAQAEGTTP